MSEKEERKYMLEILEKTSIDDLRKYTVETIIKNDNTNFKTEIMKIPNMLPNELVGENYVVKTTSVKVIDGIWNNFKKIQKSSTHSSIEILSLALLEFTEKYGSN